MEMPHRPCDPEHCELNNEAVLERIAERAAEKAITKMTEQIYQEIGKGLVRKFIYVVGAGATALFFYLKQTGIMK
jgi:hypothetical protein